jgi:hypothetical protein
MTRQLMRTARTLEAEWRQVLRERMIMGTEEVVSSVGRVLDTGFHNVTARSRLRLV